MPEETTQPQPPPETTVHKHLIEIPLGNLANIVMRFLVDAILTVVEQQMILSSMQSIQKLDDRRGIVPPELRLHLDSAYEKLCDIFQMRPSDIDEGPRAATDDEPAAAEPAEPAAVEIPAVADPACE